MQYKSITPEQYFSLKIDDIKAVRVGAEKYDYMVNLVKELRKCRNSKVLTQKVLDPFFKTPFDDKEEVEGWLMSALRNDYSFVYAYNCMVEDQNFTGYRYEEKFVSEYDLLTLLFEEDEAHEQNTLSEKEMYQHKTASKILDIENPYLKQKLINIYDKAIDTKVIECTDESFLYWFGGKPGVLQPTIRWKKMYSKNKPHKAAIYWFCKEINPKLKPKEMTEIFNIEINHNNNKYSPEEDMLQIFQ